MNNLYCVNKKFRIKSRISKVDQGKYSQIKMYYVLCSIIAWHDIESTDSLLWWKISMNRFIVDS